MVHRFKTIHAKVTVFAFLLLLISTSALAAPPFDVPPPFAERDPVFQAVDVIDADSGQPTTGGATLLREHDSIQLQMGLQGLAEDAVYTVWFVIFDAALCSDAACGGDDLGTSAHLGTVHATGFVTGTDGTANLDAELDVGPKPAGKCCGGGFLMDSLVDEVHAVGQLHGEEGAILPGEFDDKLTNPSGDTRFFAIFPPAD